VVSAKETALERLRSRGVFALDLWSVPHPSLEPGRYPVAAERRRTVMGLPVHQELRRSDLKRIAEAV
jgi:hypothetical protein